MSDSPKASDCLGAIAFEDAHEPRKTPQSLSSLPKSEDLGENLDEHQHDHELARQWLDGFRDHADAEKQFKDVERNLRFLRAATAKPNELVLELNGRLHNLKKFPHGDRQVNDRIRELCTEYLHEGPPYFKEEDCIKRGKNSCTMSHVRHIVLDSLGSYSRTVTISIAQLASALCFAVDPIYFPLDLSRFCVREKSESMARCEDHPHESGARKRFEVMFLTKYWDLSKTERSVKFEGLVPDRRQARFPGGDGSLGFVERRSSVHFALKLFGGVAASSILTIRDVDAFTIHSPFKNRSDGQIGGLEAFLRNVDESMRECCNGWSSCLFNINRLGGIEMEDSLDKEKWESFMFDESFRLSKTCFSVIQLLAIADDWVKETEVAVKDLIQGLRGLADNENSGLDAATRKELGSMIDQGGDRWRANLKAVRDTMEKMSTRSKTLQDVLFNATSLRETTNSIALNRAIYVFTIVTVFYTPLAFLVGFWALPFMSSQQQDGTLSTPRGFIATSIVVPIATYLGAILFALYMGSTRFRAMIFALLASAKSLWDRKVRRPRGTIDGGEDGTESGKFPTYEPAVDRDRRPDDSV